LSWLAVAATAALSIALAMLLPIPDFNSVNSALPGAAYMLLFVLRPALRHLYGRRLAALTGAGA